MYLRTLILLEDQTLHLCGGTPDDRWGSQHINQPAVQFRTMHCCQRTNCCTGVQSDGARFTSQARPCCSNWVSVSSYYSLSTGKCWVEFVRVHAMEADSDSWVITPPILNLGARWMSVVSLTPQPFYPRGTTRYLLHRWLVESQNTFGSFEQEKYLL